MELLPMDVLIKSALAERGRHAVDWGWHSQSEISADHFLRQLHIASFCGDCFLLTRGSDLLAVVGILNCDIAHYIAAFALLIRLATANGHVIDHKLVKNTQEISTSTRL